MKHLAFSALGFSGLLLAAFFASCGGSKKSPTGPTQLVQLETSPCRGFCPTYSMTFWSDGNVEWDGQRSVKKMGKEAFQLSKLELGDLKMRVEKAGLGSFENEFKSGIADAPGSKISFWEKGKKRTIRIEGGAKLPAKLQGFEAFLRDLGEAHGYDTRKGHNPNEPDEATVQTIIVQFKPEVNAGNWMMQWTDLKAGLERRLRADVNIWVVKFDSSIISADDLIATFKANPDVVLAQKNLNVRPRE